MIEKYSPFNPPANYWGRSWKSLLQLILNGLTKSFIVVSCFYWVKNLSSQIRLQETIQINTILYLLLSALLIILLRLHERYTAEKMSQKYINAVRSSLLKRLMRVSIREIQSKTIGNLSSRLAGDLSAIKRWLSLGMSRLITHSILIAVVIGLIMSINSTLGIIIAFAILILSSLTMYLGYHLKASIKLVRTNRIKINSLLVERLSAISAIRAMGQEKKEIILIKKHARKLEKNIAKQGIYLGMLRGVGDASSIVLISLFFSFNIINNNHLSVEDITALISIILFLNSPIRELGRVLEYYQGAKLSINKIHELYQYNRIVRGKTMQQKMKHRSGVVNVKNLNLKGLFVNFNLNIKAGEHVALLGKNGSGKSTLFELLLGLIKPDSGYLKVNGVLPLKMLPSEKARHIGTVGTDVILLKGSLKNNLQYRVENVNEEDLKSAIETCQLQPLINKLSNGINTKIREHGKNFSAGEKARISLCRAILTSPSILLLDEPENYLDSKGLAIIKKLIVNYSGTLIIATHNNELIKLCQRSVVLGSQKISGSKLSQLIK